MVPVEDCGTAVPGLGADFVTERLLPGVGSVCSPLSGILRDAAEEDREPALGTLGTKSRSTFDEVECIRNATRQTNRMIKAMPKPTKWRGRPLPKHCSS